MRFELCKQFAVSTNHISTCRGISEITQLERQTCGFPNWQTNPLDPLRSVALEITVAFISRGIFSDPHSEFAHPLAYTLAHSGSHSSLHSTEHSGSPAGLYPGSQSGLHSRSSTALQSLVYPLAYTLSFTHWPTQSAANHLSNYNCSTFLIVEQLSAK